jgi:hypothetical protein
MNTNEILESNVDVSIWEEPTTSETAVFEDTEKQLQLTTGTLNQMILYISSDKPDGK